MRNESKKKVSFEVRGVRKRTEDEPKLPRFPTRLGADLMFSRSVTGLTTKEEGGRTGSATRRKKNATRVPKSTHLLASMPSTAQQFSTDLTTRDLILTTSNVLSTDNTKVEGQLDLRLPSSPLLSQPLSFPLLSSSLELTLTKLFPHPQVFAVKKIHGGQLSPS